MYSSLERISRAIFISDFEMAWGKMSRYIDIAFKWNLKDLSLKKWRPQKIIIIFKPSLPWKLCVSEISKDPSFSFDWTLVTMSEEYHNKIWERKLPMWTILTHLKIQLMISYRMILYSPLSSIFQPAMIIQLCAIWIYSKTLTNLCIRTLYRTTTINSGSEHCWDKF